MQKEAGDRSLWDTPLQLTLHKENNHSKRGPRNAEVATAVAVAATAAASAAAISSSMLEWDTSEVTAIFELLVMGLDGQGINLQAN